MSTAAHEPRPAGQVVHERAMGEVSDVILNLDHAIARAKKAVSRLGESPEEHNAVLALKAVRVSLEASRDRLKKDTFYSDAVDVASHVARRRRPVGAT